MRVIAVTEMDRKIYDETGKRFIETFLEYWPKEITLHVYLDEEGIPFDCPFDNRIELHRLANDCPDIDTLKKRLKGYEPKDYTKDAVRFAHKSFPVMHATTTLGADKVFWIDADVVTFKDIPMAVLLSWLPDDVYTCCLKRVGYSECGFVGYNASQPVNAVFMAAWRNLYMSGAFRNLEQYHDCIMYDMLRGVLGVRAKNLSPKEMHTKTDSLHPFIFGPLGEYMDHLKGNRKKIGHSPEHPLCYWEQKEHLAL